MVNWDVNFPCLNQEDTVNLKVPFSEKEVYRKLMEVDGNKALGLDGFHFKFVQTLWLVFKEDLMSLFRYFFNSAKLEYRFSSSMISLILKVVCPASLNDFQLMMSLLEWVHKLVAHVLATKHRRVLGL